VESEVFMPMLKARGGKWLKGFHLLAVSCWVGGAIALMLLYFVKDGVTDGGVLYGINRSIHHVDMLVVVIPGAFGCLITGLFYSAFTPWGFFKHRWLIFKWAVTVGAILFGTFFLGPWETGMMEISGRLGITALGNREYLYDQGMNLAFGCVQCLVLVLTVFISVFKPWRTGKTKAPAQPAGKGP
jgi:uncharacterized membrane protein